MFGKVSVFALFAGLVAAQLHEPVGDSPSGNAITRPLNEQVPAGEPFEITWTPTTTNTISLVLLKGPSENAVFHEVIVEGIENSGSFSWTPSTALEGTEGITGYGIQLIDDVTGQYQYSTQFGILNEEPTEPSSTPSGYPTGTPIPTYESSLPPAYNSTKVYPTSVITTHYTASTGFPNTTIIYPTKSLTVPSSLKTSATPTGSGSPTTTAPPESTGAAGHIRAGLGLAGAMAAAILML